MSKKMNPEKNVSNESHQPHIIKKTLKAIHNNKKNKQQLEPGHFKAGSIRFGVLASSGVVVGLVIARISLKVDRQTLIVHHFTGQDQMFGFIVDPPNPTGPRDTPHGDKGESLVADAQVILVYFPP